MKNKNDNVYQKMLEHYKKLKTRKTTTGSIIKWPVYGKMTLRVLPKHPDQKFPYFVGARHFNLPGSKWPEWCPAICTSHLDEQLPCPIDEFAADLSKSSSKEDKDLAKSLRATPRYYFNVVIRKIVHEDGKKEIPEQTPVIIEVPETVWSEMVGFFYLNSDVNLESAEGQVDGDEILDYTDAYDGRDIILVKSHGKGNRVEYRTSLAVNPTPLGTDDEINSFLEGQKNLDEFIPSLCKSYEDLRVALLGKDSDSSADEPEDEEYTPRTSSRKVVEPEDEDDEIPFDSDGSDSPSEDEEDDEPVAPKPTPKKAAAPSPTSSALADLVKKQMSKRSMK